MRKEKGFTIIEIIIVLSIVSVASALMIPQLVSSQKKSETMTINSDREMLKTKSSIYYLNTSEHPSGTNPLSELMDKDTMAFTDWLCDKMGLAPGQNASYTEIDKRFVWLSSKKLMDEKLIDEPPVDDRYVLDTQTYTVYHVTDTEDVRNKLFTESGGGGNTLDTLKIRRFPIETSTTYMDKVNSAILAGNIIYAGGSGTMQLARIEVKATTQEVTDMSSKLPDVKEVHGVSSIGNGLRVEYTDTSDKLRIVKIDF